MVEWKRFKIQSRTVTPRDELIYLIPRQVLTDSEIVLREYGKLRPAAEGIVYWAGKKEENKIEIQGVIAPKAITTRYGVMVDHEANRRVVEELYDLGLVHIGQVHTHPSKWVGHSPTDDQCAAFRKNGLLSLVIPEFCKSNFDINKAGIHRYNDQRFSRLSRKYISSHFQITETKESTIFKDLRHE